MKEIKQIDESLSETIRKSDLQQVSAVILDSVIDIDLPIVRTIFGIGKTIITFNDQLFLKKIIAFLAGIKDIPQEKRMEMIDLVNESQKQRIKVGEKLIYILDKCDDFIDAQYIAQLFCAFLREEINYQDFLRGSRIIQNIFIGDLEYFLDNEVAFFIDDDASPRDEDYPLMSAGILVYNIYSELYEHNDGREEYKLDETHDVWITSAGKQLKAILKKISTV